MCRRSSLLALLLFLGFAGSTTGCVSFTGPNMLASRVAADGNVKLHRKEGISVGPIGVALANAIIGDKLPISADGLDWVDVGSYTIEDETEPFRVSSIELDGYTCICRIREAGSETVILADESTDTLRRAVMLSREGDELNVVRIEGDLERVLSRALDVCATGAGGLLDGGWMDEFDIDL